MRILTISVQKNHLKSGEISVRKKKQKGTRPENNTRASRPQGITNRHGSAVEVTAWFQKHLKKYLKKKKKTMSVSTVCPYIQMQFKDVPSKKKTIHKHDL